MKARGLVSSWCPLCRFNGVVTLREKAPDAMTSYMVSAFAVDDFFGLGVSQRSAKVRRRGRGRGGGREGRNKTGRGREREKGKERETGK